MASTSSYYDEVLTTLQKPDTTFQKAYALKDIKKAVYMEVPEGAKPFTSKIVIEKDNSIAVYLMLDDVDQDINIFGGSFVTVNRRLYAYFGHTKFSFCGYFLRGKNAENYNVKDGTIYIYDLYINDNFADFPFLTELVRKAGFNMLPLISVEPYAEDTLKALCKRRSVLTENMPVNKILVRSYIEDIEATYATTKYNRAVAVYTHVFTNSSNLPAVKETKIPITKETEEEVIEELQPIETALDNPDFLETEREIDKIIDEINNGSKDKNIDDIVEEALKESIKDLFDFYITVDTVMIELVNRGIKINRDNYFIILCFLKSKFTINLLNDTTFKEIIKDEVKYASIDRVATGLVKEFMKEMLKI